MTEGEKQILKFFALQAEGRGDIFRVRKNLIVKPGRRGPRWLPQFVAHLDGKPVRRGRNITAWQFDRATIMHHYALIMKGREIPRKEKTDERHST